MAFEKLPVKRSKPRFGMTKTRVGIGGLCLAVFFAYQANQTFSLTDRWFGENDDIVASQDRISVLSCAFWRMHEKIAGTVAGGYTRYQAAMFVKQGDPEAAYDRLVKRIPDNGNDIVAYDYKKQMRAYWCDPNTFYMTYKGTPIATVRNTPFDVASFLRDLSLAESALRKTLNNLDTQDESEAGSVLVYGARPEPMISSVAPAELTEDERQRLEVWHETGKYFPAPGQ